MTQQRERVSWRLKLLLHALLLILPSIVLAQNDPHAGHTELTGAVSRELMERPTMLTNAPGRLHQAVSSDSPQAQAFYDQGIAYLASYVWVEAARSFHQALREDSNLAMAHLGLAKAYAGVDARDERQSHLKKAQELAAAGHATPKEAQWIALGVQQQEAIQAPLEERASLHQAYKQAIELLIAEDPKDPHAWILRGNAEEPGPWGRGQVGKVGSIAYYEAALQRDPHNLAAHHFLIHSYENIGRHDIAAEHGKAYATEAKEIPHAQHMYGHVLPRLGKWQEALQQLSEADRLERKYYADQNIAPEEDWHHGHNLHLLGTVQLRLGNEAEAERLFKEAFALKGRGPLADRYTAPWIEHLLLRERFEEALQTAVEVERRSSPLAQVIGATLAGEAYIGLGRIDDAKKALERAEAAESKVAQALQHSPYESFASHFTQSFITTLSSEIALRGRTPEDGERQFIAMADALAVNPRLDAWADGLFRLERMARDARRAGRPELAQALIERVHKIDPEFTSTALAAANQ
jgi:tetratricopeptide (TPR) repeat protein